MYKHLLSLLTVLVLISCSNKTNYQADLQKADYLHDSMKNLSDIMVHDIFSPPVASRIYTYPSIAAYEVIARFDENYNSMEGQLRHFPEIDSSLDQTMVQAEIAAVYAFNTVGKAMIFSTEKMDEFVASLDAEYEALGVPKSVLNASISYGETIAHAILDWASEDNYNETRSFPRYTVDDKPGTWKPTPPKYMDGIEPHWREIRPMVLESSSQFKPADPTSFDVSEKSQFYKETLEVYETVKNASEEEIEIASFWDCNPYVMNLKGHLMFATKKITPGGHWIGITRLACIKDSADIKKSALAYSMCSIALFDAFISCWDEKYRSNLIRPETVINEYIDPDWKPTLQTPPFPEHTSGHSVASSAAAIVLTDIFGDNFSFEDTVELEFGLPVRTFNSFLEASEEAAISRLYGGIHYRPAIDLGVKQGRSLGRFILENIDLNS